MSVTTPSLIESLLQHDRPAAWWGLDTADPLVDDSGHGYTLTAVGTPSNSASLHTRGDTGASGCRDFNGTTGAYDVFGTITGPAEILPTYPEFFPAGVTINNLTDTATVRTSQGAEVGDLMLAYLMHGTNTATIVTPDADWTVIGNVDFTTGRLYVYRRIATSADIPGGTHTWVWSASGAITGVIVAYRGYDTSVAGGVFDSGLQASSSFTAHGTTTETHPNAAICLAAFAADVTTFFTAVDGGTVITQWDDANGNPFTPDFVLVQYQEPFAGSSSRVARTNVATTCGTALVTFGAPDEVLEDALDTITENISIHALVNLDTVSGVDTIIRKHQAWGVDINAGVLRFQYRDGGGVDRTVTGPTLTTATTYRIWVVDDGTDIHFYVNGSKTSASRTGSAGYTTNLNRVTIGAYHDGASHTNFLDGRIDEPAVFAAAVSQEMILTHEQAATQGTFGDFLQADHSGRYPRAKVELAIDSNPGDACPVFTDLNSANARAAGAGIRASDGISVQSANREFEQDRMQAGTLTLTLSNRDNRYATLKPRRVIRLRAQAQTDGPVFPIFYGYTDAPTFNRGGFGEDSTVALTATDAFKALALSVIREELSRPVEYPGTRIEDVLEDVDGLQFSLDEGQRQVAAIANLQGTNRLEHCQAVAETDGGIFYCDARGRAVFQDSHHRSLNERTVRATYGWTNTSAAFPCKEFRPIVDETRLFTAAEITPSSGNVQRAVSAAAALEFFETTRSFTTLHASESDALALAHHVVNRYSAPVVRIPRLVLQPAGYQTAPQTMWAAVLGHEIGNRVKTIEKPIGASVEVPREHFIEGVSHSLSASDWLVSLSLSPAELEGDYFIIGTSAIEGDDTIGY